MVHVPSGPRTVALIGPYGSGKSTLFEALLAAAGTPLRRGAERGGTELRVAHTTYLDEPWTLIDAPGSVEFCHQAHAALAVADIAVLVTEPDPARAPTAAPLLRALDEIGLPFLVFVNRIDTLAGQVRDTMAALQGHTKRPLVLRQVPIRSSPSRTSDARTAPAVTGYVDVVSERAYAYRRGAASDLIALPPWLAAREQEARAGLVEVLADHDDALLEKVIEDIVPTSSELFERLHHDEADGTLAELLLGAADRSWGVRRLWKALRHDAPCAAETAARKGVDAQVQGSGEAPLVQVFRTINAGHGGKLSWARVWRGGVRDGAALNGNRVGGLWRAPGGELTKGTDAEAGEIVALGRLDGVATGAVLGEADGALLDFPQPPAPVQHVAITTVDRKDDVRLSAALTKLLEEDPSLFLRQDPELGETILGGQGDLHLKAAVNRLAEGYGVRIEVHRPKVAFRETIRKPVQQHGRLKRQTGGHGQFADVKLEVAPLARGEGFRFIDRIVGGAVPRQYIPAVGEAAAEAARKGVFGFPVVDLEVTLVDGGFHSVDSSDMAFRSATRAAIAEALTKADPVLLEPVDHVTVCVPNDTTAAAQRLLTGRRGQILGYAARDGWEGWDEVQALVPAAELHDLITELRSLTMGLGTFRRQFDHLAEAPGRMAQAVAAGR